MWKVKIQVQLVNDEPSESTGGQNWGIEEEIPGGWEGVEQWEQQVRQIGFGLMRQLFARGLRLQEQNLFSTLGHQDKNCRLVKRGQKSFTLGLRQLSSLCAAHQPYRLAEKMVRQVIHDQEGLSAKTIHSLAKQEGQRVRDSEEQERERLFLESMRQIVQRQPEPGSSPGVFYVCLDGIHVRSTRGKGRWREGKVGLLFTHVREPIGRRGRWRVSRKQYISSFDSVEVFGARVICIPTVNAAIPSVTINPLIRPSPQGQSKKTVTGPLWKLSPSRRGFLNVAGRSEGEIQLSV